jgi:transcriptional regulator GlxA family with amidase domain
MALERVAVLNLPGVAPFELGVVCEVFGLDRTDMGVPKVELTMVTPQPGEVPTNLGFTLNVPDDLTAARGADLICVPAFPHNVEVGDDVVDLLTTAVADGARVMSVCSGAFVLGHAGLLDNRICTTHWMYTDRLAAQFPAAKVDPMVLYVEDGPILTSAGTAAGIDLGLYILRQEFGAAAASVVARRMVVPPHRDGGQAQYISRPVVTGDSLSPLLDWMSEHLGDDLSVADLAERCHTSVRTFARRFLEETGTTPHRWLTQQRVDAAAGLLESTDHGLDEIARRCGLGDAALLRHHFKTVRGTTPRAYRAAFRG